MSADQAGGSSSNKQTTYRPSSAKSSSRLNSAARPTTSEYNRANQQGCFMFLSQNWQQEMYFF